ncbi:hypothetical protein FOZ62_010254 [Perkinsus olseni]|uniref:Uncharacterized protein n=1 Tax=Perkinsus olseni TaxID=32597 RepID=A0A7J6QGY2_PEROL|nr:hypothetical protein FOZ62_010254 [Perkinsus olseni]
MPRYSAVFVLSLVLAVTSATTLRAADQAGSPTTRRLDRLEKQLTGLAGKVDKLVAHMSAMTAFTYKIEVEAGVDRACSALFVDGSLSFKKGDKDYSIAWKGNGRLITYWENVDAEISFMDFNVKKHRAFEGTPEAVMRLFSLVLPFNLTDLMPKIKQLFDGRMTEDKCSILMKGVLQNPPKEYKQVKPWLQKFIQYKMAEALELAGKHGGILDW